MCVCVCLCVCVCVCVGVCVCVYKEKVVLMTTVFLSFFKINFESLWCGLFRMSCS